MGTAYLEADCLKVVLEVVRVRELLEQNGGLVA